MTTKKYFIANIHTDWLTYEIEVDIAPYLHTISSDITRNLLINKVGEARDNIAYGLEDSNPFIAEFLDIVNDNNLGWEVEYDSEELKQWFITN